MKSDSGVVLKPLSAGDHRVLRNAHDMLSKQVATQERELKQLQARIKALDPAAYKAEINSLKDTLKNVQDGGTAGGLMQRLENEQLVSRCLSHLLLMSSSKARTDLNRPKLKRVSLQVVSSRLNHVNQSAVFETYRKAIQSGLLFFFCGQGRS